MISNLPLGYTQEKVEEMLKSFPGVEDIDMQHENQAIVKF